MKKIVIFCMLAGIILTGCSNEPSKTYIVPNVVKCVGHLERERIHAFPKRLVCNDGRIFHSIVNYQEIISNK